MKTFKIPYRTDEPRDSKGNFTYIEVDVMVDDEDYDEVIKHNWRADRAGRTCYPVTDIKRKAVSLHHFVFGKPPKGLVTDHRDRNGCNAQKSNLRFVTHRQNLQNSHKTNSCPYPGVYFKKEMSVYRYSAQIRIDGKAKYLGAYKTAEDAFLAYQAECNKLGEEVLDYGS